jgi:hypothetical protein
MPSEANCSEATSSLLQLSQCSFQSHTIHDGAKENVRFVIHTPLFLPNSPKLKSGQRELKSHFYDLSPFHAHKSAQGNLTQNVQHHIPVPPLSKANYSYHQLVQTVVFYVVIKIT